MYGRFGVICAYLAELPPRRLNLKCQSPLGEAGIDRIIDAFEAGAERNLEAGFKAIEIHPPWRPATRIFPKLVAVFPDAPYLFGPEQIPLVFRL